jgi:hypothetical protein
VKLNVLKEYKVRKSDLMEANLLQLKKDYIAKKIVPFIGAGLSVPFQVPTWKKLIEDITEKYAKGNHSFIKDAINFHLQKNDYWGAVTALKYYANLEDPDINSQIVELIKENQIKLEDDNLHNYRDIANMNFNLHLTTNYEFLLYKYLNCEDIPILLRDINFNTQDMFDIKRVFHLHGHISNPGSIVISKESYDELYTNAKYDNLLKAVTSNKKLLFMGFSFDDQFIRTLIKDHKSYFGSNHYILLNNPTADRVSELRKDYGLITIDFRTENSSHTIEIRKILQMISETPEQTEIAIQPAPSEPVLLGAGISDMTQNVENNLFYKKLLLENIDSSTIELSSYFYIAAEIYIRELRKNGMSIDVINAILAKVFIKYRERYSDSYKKHGDSQQFLEDVHSSLENIDFGRYARAFSENEKSDEDENRGLIHVLAEDASKEIWWGEKKLNEEKNEHEIKKEVQTNDPAIN